MDSSTWVPVLAGAVGGLLSLAGVGVSVGFTARHQGRQQRAKLAATFLAACDRIESATTLERAEQAASNLRARREVHDFFVPLLQDAGRAGYELILISNDDIADAVNQLLEVNQQLLFASVPALASEEERRQALRMSVELRRRLTAKLRGS